MSKITLILEASAKLYLTITKTLRNLREWQSKLKEKHTGWLAGGGAQQHSQRQTLHLPHLSDWVVF